MTLAEVLPAKRTVFHCTLAFRFKAPFDNVIDHYSTEGEGEPLLISAFITPAHAKRLPTDNLAEDEYVEDKETRRATC